MVSIISGVFRFRPGRAVVRAHVQLSRREARVSAARRRLGSNSGPAQVIHGRIVTVGRAGYRGAWPPGTGLADHLWPTRPQWPDSSRRRYRTATFMTAA